MPVYAEINSHPTNSDRIQVKLNDLATVKNYLTLNPQIEEISDVRDSADGSFIEIIMKTTQNYYIAATPVWSPEKTGIFPVDKVNGVAVNTNPALMTAIFTLIKPPVQQVTLI